MIHGLLKQKCVIFITHQLQFVQLADNILAIKNVSLSLKFSTDRAKLIQTLDILPVMIASVVYSHVLDITLVLPLLKPKSLSNI